MGHMTRDDIDLILSSQRRNSKVSRKVIGYLFWIPFPNLNLNLEFEFEFKFVLERVFPLSKINIETQFLYQFYPEIEY